MTLRIFKREACRKSCKWNFIPPLCREIYKMTKTQYVVFENMITKRNTDKGRGLIRNYDFKESCLKFLKIICSLEEEFEDECKE